MNVAGHPAPWWGRKSLSEGYSHLTLAPIAYSLAIVLAPLMFLVQYYSRFHALKELHCCYGMANELL